jgi:hypothetical protein
MAEGRRWRDTLRAAAEVRDARVICTSLAPASAASRDYARWRSCGRRLAEAIADAAAALTRRWRRPGLVVVAGSLYLSARRDDAR